MKRRRLTSWNRRWMAAGVILIAAGTGWGQARKPRPVPNTCAGVVTHQGRPIEGAQVQFVWLTHPELPPSLVRAVDLRPIRKFTTRSKNKGRFHTGLPHRGPFAVFARKGELRSSLAFPVVAGDYLSLRLEPVRYLEGTVVDADGTAVADAMVSKCNPVRFAIKQKYRHHPRPTDVVRTDRRGRFRLPVWAVADHTTVEYRSLRAWTGERMSTGEFYFNTGQIDGDPELRLSRSRTVRGGVFAAVDQPNAKAKAIANAMVSDPVEIGRSIRTDAAGRFVFAAATSHSLVVQAPGYSRVEVRLDRSSRFDLKLARGLRIRMRLVHGQVALAGCRVVLASPVAYRNHLPWVTEVGENGALELDSVNAGVPLSGFVEFEGRFVRFLSLVPVADQDLGLVRLVTERTIAGRIRNAHRQPVVGARVFLQPRLSAKEYARLDARANQARSVLSRVTYTDRAGRYQFEGVFPGELLLGVNAASEGYYTTRVASNREAPLNITIPKGRQVIGRVLLQNGQPAAHAHIQYIFRTPGDAGRFSSESGMCYLHLASDAEGRFTVSGLAPHTSYTSYALYTEAGNGFRSLLTGTVAESGEIRVEHRLSPHAARN